jgi:chromosome segregation ATPase
MERDIAASQAELGAKEGAISRLMGQLKAAVERGDVAVQRLADVDNAHNAGEAGEAAVRKRVSQLQTSVDLLQGEKSSLLIKIDQSERENKSQLGELSVQVDQLQRNLTDKTQQVERLTQSSDMGARANDAAVALRLKVESLSAEAVSQEAFLLAASTRVEVLEGEVAVLTAAQAPDAVGLEERLISLQGELAEVKGLKQSLQEDLGTYITIKPTSSI